MSSETFDGAGRVIRPGMTLEVTDLSHLTSARKPPFAKGAILVCDRVNGPHVSVRGHPGYWKARRFEVRSNG